MYRKGIHVETPVKWLIGIVIIAVVLAIFIPGVKTLAANLFGFLNKNYGITESGKYLYLRLDPEQNKLLEFYLTNEPKQNLIRSDQFYFMPDLKSTTLPSDKCVIYSVRELQLDVFGDYMDRGYYYYVNSGTRIQYGTCSSLGNCIIDGIFAKNCNFKIISGCFPPKTLSLTECYNQGKGDYYLTYCYCMTGSTISCFKPEACVLCQTDDDRNRMESFEFTDSLKLGSSCELNNNNPKDPSKCNIVVPGQYIVKYGLICDDKGIWQPCTKDVADKATSIPVGGNDYTCCLSSQNTDVFVWVLGDTC